MKSVHKRGNVIMDNEIKNVFFDIEIKRTWDYESERAGGCLPYGCNYNVKNIRQNGKGWSVKERK